MSESIKKIGILTGGGDCPGLNAVIRAVVKSATLMHGWQVVGIPDGFDGLIWPERLRPLGIEEIRGILPRGGTILGTSNRGNPFAYPVKENGVTVLKDMSPVLLENFNKVGLDALVIVGGDGTQKIGLELWRQGVRVVGVPKTIDNDLSATEITFGFDTALHTATEAIDKLHTTAESHHRVILMEVMGRDAGWIALESGIAGGAHVILIPEIPCTIQKICEKIDERAQIGSFYSIIVVAEGCQYIDGASISGSDQNRRQTPRSGEVANAIGSMIARSTQKETRVTVLGHIQRGGTPSPFDRVLSSRFGVAAVELIARGQFGHMVCLRCGSIESTPIEKAVGQLKTVDPNGEMVRTARALGISFGN
ncbi:MAG: 6-phosphofructokinase [Acidobacteria bacterium RIFCSPLOWO2_12_FULL_54_10]|nr:MAG: 6-phosphofructokinase [Acidobacteria bacterium RIFCSPLOWO2_12_FULL_54_10]